MVDVAHTEKIIGGLRMPSRRPPFLFAQLQFRSQDVLASFIFSPYAGIMRKISKTPKPLGKYTPQALIKLDRADYDKWRHIAAECDEPLTHLFAAAVKEKLQQIESGAVKIVPRQKLTFRSVSSNGSGTDDDDDANDGNGAELPLVPHHRMPRRRLPRTPEPPTEPVEQPQARQKVWTPEKDELLRTLHADRTKSIRERSNIIGISISGYYKRCEFLGLPPTKSGPKLKERRAVTGDELEADRSKILAILEEPQIEESNG